MHVIANKTLIWIITKYILNFFSITWRHLKWSELQYLEVHIRDGVNFRWPLGHCGRIWRNSTFQGWFKCKERILMVCGEDNGYHCIQCGGQPTCIHKELQSTNKGIVGPLQHPQDEELMEHYFRMLQLLHAQDANNWWLVDQQGQGICRSTWLFRTIYIKQKIAIILLKSLSSLHEHLITALEM